MNCEKSTINQSFDKMIENGKQQQMQQKWAKNI